MKVKVNPAAGFKRVLGNEVDVELGAQASVSELLDALCSRHRDMRSMAFCSTGLRDDVNILVNGRNIDSLQGLATGLSDGDKVVIFPAAIGG